MLRSKLHLPQYSTSKNTSTPPLVILYQCKQAAKVLLTTLKVQHLIGAKSFVGGLCDRTNFDEGSFSFRNVESVDIVQEVSRITFPTS